MPGEVKSLQATTLRSFPFSLKNPNRVLCVGMPMLWNIWDPRYSEKQLLLRRFVPSFLWADANFSMYREPS